MKKSQFIFILILFSVGCTTPTRPVLELVAGLSACRAVETSYQKIVGGEKVALGDPDQSLVILLKMRRSDHDSVCTGTLISDRVILTAAHCVAGLSPTDVSAQFVVREGCPVNRRREILATVERIVIHKNFDGTPQSMADLALLYLEEKAPKEQQRLPAMLPGDKPSIDKILFIGYGITDEAKKDSQVLRRVYKSIAHDLHFKDRSILVNQKDRRGFCRGDSGAPILAEKFGEPFILGINSANIGLTPNTECHIASLAMDTRYFADWITDGRKALEEATWLGNLFSSSVQRF